MNSMKETQRNKWEIKRAKGKKNFVIFNGIIGWGIPTAILVPVISSSQYNFESRIFQDFIKDYYYFSNLRYFVWLMDVALGGMDL
jgi:hypothetical protein